MKLIIFVALFAVTACNAQTNATPSLETTKVVKAEEDCDDKAKQAQKVEIKDDEISLTNNTAGCTLDEEVPQK